MALDYSDWAAGEDEQDSFDRAPFDHEAARARMVARIARTLKQLNGEKVGPKGGRDFTPLHNNGVLYQPTLNDQPIWLPGLPEDGVRISRSALSTKLTAFSRDVESGHFDDQLERALQGDGSSKPKVARAARSSTGLGKTAQPDDAEWMAKFTAKHGPAPSADHVPNSKGTGWVTKARQAATKAAAEKRYGK